MTTTSVTNQTTSGTAAGSSDAISTALGGGSGSVSDLFIKLLVAQIKNQDPLEPTDPAEFVGQLTQLSQMEALQALAGQGSSQTAALASLQVMTLGGQVGSQVTVQSNQVQLDGMPVDVGFTLASPSTKTTLVLTSAGGQKTTVELGTQPAGHVGTTLDPAKLGLAAGTYTMSVTTSSGETPATQVTGVLSNVQINSAGAAMAQVSGVGQILAANITGFNGRPVTLPN
ncbi:flagellar hook capping FlgD N-terminal domain-containing protein [Pseudorhodoferax sp.]|uniref:flagellar hook capping FlgD N-terminal domain-containing protein n=1 Tax=Pseudorhodoferax sp. TaxID=1993553 RepID=UPI002DD62BB9|nr:flagellar hook capping FlgD N-terminal domain-containing protein [Pseudorhodoferax sp.]